MAQAHSHAHPPPPQPPSRPSLTTFSPGSYPRDFMAHPPSRPGSFSASSPITGLPLSASSPQVFSPPSYAQPPAAKKPRLSPDVASPFTSAPPTPSGNVASPAGGTQTPSGQTPLNRPGLMAPPQRPADRIAEDRNYDDILSGTGINIEEEARNLTRPDYFGTSTPTTSFQSRPGSFEFGVNSFGQSGSSTAVNNPYSSNGGLLPEPSDEEKEKREHERADWEAGRHTQHALWDMFLYGGTLNDKVKSISQKEHLVDTQAGVLVNTQRHAPPPLVRINGLEGASRVIDQGQSILDTGSKADRLAEVLKVVSLAARSRLSGLLSAAARLSVERQQHSKGQIPTEWADMAVVAKPIAEDLGAEPSPSTNSIHKRKHSQIDGEESRQADATAAPNQVANTFQKAGETERSEEDTRRAKRLKRKAANTADSSTGPAGTEVNAETVLAAAGDVEKKTTKKERKLAESKFSEQQQHKSANEAARMAVSGLLGNRFGNLGAKKGRTYDWMNSGKSGTSTPTLTPGRPTLSAANSATVTPTSERIRSLARERQVGEWDEEKDPGVQARDILLVLESDGKAARSYAKGYSLVEG